MLQLDQDEKKAFFELIEEGKKDFEIRHSMQIPQSTVLHEKKILRNLGLIETKQRGKPKTIITQEMENRIVDMSVLEFTNKEMAKDMGVSIQTIIKWKNILRSRGRIIKSTTSKGRPKLNYACPHCGGLL